MSSLFVIEETLPLLMDERQDILAGAACSACLGTGAPLNPCRTCNNTGVRIDQDALAAVDAAIVEYVKAEVRKADNIARYIKSCDEHATAKRREAERLTHEAKLDEERRDRVKAMVLQIMRDVDKKKIQGDTYTLSRVGNGGVQAVEVAQQDLVPEKFRTVTVRMALNVWVSLSALVPQSEETKIVSSDENLTAIRRELEKRIPCPSECDSGVIYVDDGTEPCPICGGTGEVANGVPGARLAERGEHLRVK